jgi:hypothetical protein
MRKRTRNSLITLGAIVGALALMGAGCTSDADTVSENIATEAEQFNVQRTIVATSGITGENLLYVEGRCSFETSGKRIDLTCKQGPEDYRKHTFLFGDQDSIYVAMEESIDVSEYHTKIIIKPQNIIPEFDISIGEDE